jgi:molybdopterin/thiamine biosynthesis adenylyltransferase
MNRHGRQTRLAEVGSAGQARIASARVEVAGDGLDAFVAARYLAGAGVGSVCVGSEALAAAVAPVDAAVHVEVDRAGAAEAHVDAFDLRDPAARAVARGARSALNALRAILEPSPPSDGRSS